MKSYVDAITGKRYKSKCRQAWTRPVRWRRPHHILIGVNKSLVSGSCTG